MYVRIASRLCSGTAKFTYIGRTWLSTMSGAVSFALTRLPRWMQRLADEPVDRRADGAVLEVESGVLHRRAARRGHGLRGLGVGAELRVGVLGDEILLEQLEVALLLRAGLGGGRGVALMRRLGLPQRRLERPRVDAEQHLALPAPPRLP